MYFFNVSFFVAVSGDTLYYKFESDGSENDWGYRFTVTGGRIGRFDTGYMMLNGILCMPSVSTWVSDQYG